MKRNLRADQATRSFLAQLEQDARQTSREQAVERQILASTREAYRWGRIDNRTRQFQPPARSGDAAIYESQDLMHRRTRSEVLNNAQLKRIPEALCDLVVGPEMMTFADPFDPLMDLTDLSRETLDPLLSYALEADDLFEQWFHDRSQVDWAGKLTGPELQRMALHEAIEVGDCLLLRTQTSEPGRIVPLGYQILEKDQLDLSQDRPAGPGQNKIVHGIELDARGREVAYHILDDHPFDDFSGSARAGASSRVAASRVLHLCLYQRPSQSIGATWLHAIAQNNFDRDKFIGAEIQSAAKAALLLLVAKLKNQGATMGLLDDGDADDDFGNEQMKLGASPLAARIGPDDSVELIESARPINTADSFIKILDHGTAAGSGISYYTLTGRYESTNFSSARAALLAEDAHIRPLQNWFAAQIALPIRRDFHRQTIGLGKLQSVTARDYVANPRRYDRFDAIGAGRELLDPSAESDATANKLRTCLTTLKQECARRGQHWIRVLRQVALENRLLDLLEIALDLSKGQGGQVAGNTRSRDKQDADELKTGGDQ